MEGPSQAAVSGARPIWSGINFQTAFDISRSENHLRNNQLVQQARPALTGTGKKKWTNGNNVTCSGNNLLFQRTHRQEAELIPTRQVNKGAWDFEKSYCHQHPRKRWRECFKFQDLIPVSLKQHHQLINKRYPKNNIDYNSSYLLANIAACQCQHATYHRKHTWATLYQNQVMGYPAALFCIIWLYE